MWTATHYYIFPDEATAAAMELPEMYAVDHVGTRPGVSGWHVNARWDSSEPAAWATYRIPDPVNPVRVFA